KVLWVLQDTLGGPRHAELCFLDLIPSWDLDKNKRYSVTLFISWSPCPDCATSLVRFLLQNSHVNLRIFAARIYSRNWGYEDGLRQLRAAGAHVSIMSIDEYQHCWEAFVDHQGRPFQPYPDLHKHIQEQSQRLNEILGVRSPLPALPCSGIPPPGWFLTATSLGGNVQDLGDTEFCPRWGRDDKQGVADDASGGPGNRRPRMDMATFTENFSPQMLNETHLCYEWDVPEGDSRIPADQMKGFLRNKEKVLWVLQDTLGGPRHAELCFLDLIPSWDLDKNKRYSVTLFISWSPCPDCATSLVRFLLQNSHVNLRIFAARIYSRNWGYEDGLRQLRAAGAHVSIMSIDEYQHCWEAFVDHQGRPFQPYADLHKHIQEQSQRLNEILGVRSPLPALPCSQPPTFSLFLFPPATLPTPFNLHLRPDSGQLKMDSTL
ncbi:DNA dC-_dU-editing enzyme APOBEC-3G-like, partial [Sturnira hondurensis]|uniref:DNA dC->dU-editing enzyme APOBEC-3G-like n=1 Tax=Sturnira hondurensis TaxID=192404 RepID=UPI001879120D